MLSGNGRTRFWERHRLIGKFEEREGGYFPEFAPAVKTCSSKTFTRKIKPVDLAMTGRSCLSWNSIHKNIAHVLHQTEILLEECSRRI